MYRGAELRRGHPETQMGVFLLPSFMPRHLSSLALWSLPGFSVLRLIVVGSKLEVRSFSLSSDVSYEISTKAL